MTNQDVDNAMSVVVADSSNPIVSKCQAASVAYVVVNALAESSGTLRAAALRWVAGKISDYKKVHCA